MLEHIKSWLGERVAHPGLVSLLIIAGVLFGLALYADVFTQRDIAAAFLAIFAGFFFSLAAFGYVLLVVGKSAMKYLERKSTL